MNIAWLQAQTGSSSKNLNELWYKYLGTFNTRLSVDDRYKFWLTNVGLAPTEPTTAMLEPYRKSATSWEGIVYGPATWIEATTGLYTTQIMDVFLPSGTKPVAGWPAVMFFHANGNTLKSISSTYIADLHANGIAAISVEFRHPVTNASYGFPHTDVGLATQYVRAISTAIGLDPTRLGSSSRSRGALCIWQAMQADMANPTGSTWASRMSSRVKALWTYNAQTTYSTTEFANTFIVAGQRAAFLAENPDDPHWGSAIQSVATAPSLIPARIRHEFPFPVGLVGATDPYVGVHYPGFGSAFRDAYIAAGGGANMTAEDNIPDASAMTGAGAWFASKL